MNIFVIEDDPSFVEYLRRCLPGYDITTASNLHDAAKILAHRAFDVVWCDLKLPDASPETALASVTALAGRAAIVVASGAVENLRGLAAHAKAQKDELRSPVAVEDLVSRAVHRAAQETTTERKAGVLYALGCLFSPATQ